MAAPFGSLRDDFADNSIATTWAAITAGGGAVTEASGQARCALPSSTPGLNQAFYRSVSAYDLTGDSIYLNIAAMVATGVAANFFFDCFITGSSNFLRWTQSGGALKAQTIVGGVTTDRFSATWSSSTHKYLRIRHSSGNVLFDTSTNGTSWTNRASVAAPFDVTALKIQFGASCGNVASPGTLQIDDLNIILPALATTWNVTTASWSQRHRFRNITLAATGGQAYIAIADDVDATGALVNPRYYSGPADAGRILTLQGTQAAAQAMAVNLPADSRFELPTLDEGRIIRLYHRSISGSTYVLREFYGRRTVEADDVVSEMFRGLIFEGHQFICEQLSALTASMGNLHIDGVLDIDLAGGIYQGSGSFASPTTGLKLFNSGGVGKLSTYKATVEQVTLDTDGALKAGGGNVVLDADGLRLLAETTPIGNETAVSWEDAAHPNYLATIRGETDGSGNATMRTYVRPHSGSAAGFAVDVRNSSDVPIIQLTMSGSLGATFLSGGFAVGSPGVTPADGQIVTSGTITAQNALVSSQDDAGTNNLLNVLLGIHRTSGTPTTGFGTAITFQADSNTNTVRSTGQIYSDWSIATDASRQGRLRLAAVDSVGARVGLSMIANGSTIQIGFFGSAGTTRPTISGSRGGNAALANLLTALANLGLLTDSTT
jgi:hypothetical protein